MRGQSARANSG